MSIRVRIPSALRATTEGQSIVSTSGDTLHGCLSHLEERYPAIRARLRDEQGNLRRFVNLYVNGEDIRFLQGLDTTLKPGDELAIIPAVAGGA
jgi:molybdopterin synthase sulfur carrier subunit